MYTFSNRVVDYWNKLPCYVVDAKSVVEFKSNLDCHWKSAYVYGGTIGYVGLIVPHQPASVSLNVSVTLLLLLPCQYVGRCPEN